MFNYRLSVFVILARPNELLVRDDTWLDLPSRQVSSHRCETRNALLQEFTIVRASSFCPPTLRSLCISYGFLSFSRHPGKTFRNTCSATLRDAPWNVKRLAYIRLFPPLFSLFLSVSLFLLLLLLHLPRERVHLRFFPPSSILLIFRCVSTPRCLPLYSERRAKLVNCGIIRDPKTIMVSRERASRSCGIPGGSFALMRLLSG